MTNQKNETNEQTLNYSLDGSFFNFEGETKEHETKKHIGAANYKPHLFFRLDDKISLLFLFFIIETGIIFSKP